MGEGLGVRDVVITQAITGMGGLGKTQLAVEFAYRYGSYFRGVHWLDLANPSQLEAEIARCGMEMALANFPADQPSQVALTLNTWKADGPRLLVLDNFEAVEQVNEGLPRLRHSNLRLLVTSRRNDWTPAAGLHALPLELFSPQESLAFLKNALEKRKDQETDLQTLAERLGHLPLALELASRYLNGHARLSIADYLEQTKQAFEHPSMKDWRKDLPAPTQHDLDLQRTFALSWNELGGRVVPSDSEERIETTEENAQKLFMTAGYLAPNTPIPLEIFEKTMEISSDICDELLNTLFGLGLLRKGEEGLPTIHPLLAEYARGLAKENKEILESLVDELATISKEAIDTGLPARFVPLRSHMPVTASHAEQLNIEESVALWSNYGSHLDDIADYSGARLAFERAIIVEPDNASSINNLGETMRKMSDLSGARAAFERALKVDEADFGPDHPKVAIRVNNLASVYYALGDLLGARTAYERALKIFEKQLGENHPNVATLVNNLGMVMQAMGDLPGARTAFERAIKIWEATFGPDHPQVAIGVNNLASVYYALGDLLGARTAYERALKIFEKQLGENHPNVGALVNNLGSVMKAMGDLPGARTTYERALKIREKAFGEEHPDVAQSLWWLGVVARDEGNKESAKNYFERALQMFKKFLPPDHPDIKGVQKSLDSLENK